METVSELSDLAVTRLLIRQSRLGGGRFIFSEQFGTVSCLSGTFIVVQPTCLRKVWRQPDIPVAHHSDLYVLAGNEM